METGQREDEHAEAGSMPNALPYGEEEEKNESEQRNEQVPFHQPGGEEEQRQTWEAAWRNKFMWRLGQKCEVIINKLTGDRVISKDETEVLDVFLRNAGRPLDLDDPITAALVPQNILPSLRHQAAGQKRTDMMSLLNPEGGFVASLSEGDRKRRKVPAADALTSKQRKFYRYISIMRHTFEIHVGCNEQTLIEAQQRGVLPTIYPMEVPSMLHPPSDTVLRRLDVGKSGHGIKGAPGGSKRVRVFVWSLNSA